MFEHAGIHVTYPTPTQGAGEKPGDDESDVGKILGEKRQDLFNTYRFTKKASIRVARARAIIQRAHSKPFGSSRNVFIIMDAHAMREEAQNALLKLVEEPPDTCVVIIVTPSPDAILYTIRSRCQRIRFSPLKVDVVEAILRDYYGVKPDVAAKAAALSQGSILRAREITSGHDDDDRQNVCGILGRIQDAPEAWVVGKALTVARGGNRDAVARFLHEMAVALRDLMTGDPTLFINQDEKTTLTRMATLWDAKRLPSVVERVVDTRDGILRRNLNMDAALVDLFLAIRRS